MCLKYLIHRIIKFHMRYIKNYKIDSISILFLDLPQEHIANANANFNHSHRLDSNFLARLHACAWDARSSLDEKFLLSSGNFHPPTCTLPPRARAIFCFVVLPFFFFLSRREPLWPRSWTEGKIKYRRRRGYSPRSHSRIDPLFIEDWNSETAMRSQEFH